jgi:hypothetical protein
MKRGILAGALLAAICSGAAFAQDAIKLADVAELSGGGATVGTNWKNGIDLAIEEINAKGGVLGHKLEVTHADSQSNPGIARAGSEGPGQRTLRAARSRLFGFGQGHRAARGRSRHHPDHGR